MKRFTVPCTFGSEEAPFHIYVGTPRKEGHPLQHQSHWLNVERGGTIPAKVMESFGKLHQNAVENNINYEDLCVHTLGAENTSAEQKLLQEADKRNIGNKPKKSNKRPYITAVKWPSSKKVGASAGDNIHKPSLEKTVTHAMQVAKEMFPGMDYLSCSARNLFLGIALYLGLIPDKPLTLSETVHAITNPHADYSLAVVLDTVGGCLPALGYRLIGQWLNQSKEFRNDVLTRMTAGMIEFAFSTPKKTDNFKGMRKTLQKTLLKDEVTIG